MKKNLLNWDDTIVAIATPIGIGAIGVIRISGKNAFSIVQKLVVKNLFSCKSHTLHYCTLKYHNETLDDVVLSLFKNPQSYTGEDVIEISCHGSVFIQEKIIHVLIALGARLAVAGEFTQRAFINKKLDLIQAESVADLIASETQLAQQAAMNNLKGYLSTELKTMRETLIQFSALIELELDFSQEDVEFADRTAFYTLIKKIQYHLSLLIHSFAFGNAIKNGVKVAIIGKPNAGKSTLLNTLLQENRAIVSAIPGTTRDTIEATINIQHILFRLIDTAGIRTQSTDEIELLGIHKSVETINQAAMILFIYDYTTTNLQDFKNWINNFNIQNKKIIIIANKIDDTTQPFFEKQLNDIPIVYISAKNNIGINELKNAMVDKIIAEKVKSENTIITNTRHVSLLQQINTTITEIEQALQQQLSGDLISIHIREALYLLGSLTGEITNEDTLDYIFSKFCIGK
ncbi:MAG: tRNA uridine-5-carboxymethylaminomethyl(34) synthesis GTPase MnmE [Sediminibacterium sp.]|nr:tRNA uridine-5-carboxymethylaminomethyl(34) synthesis GTPase MnmE [Sediminibacterium sp.]